jgi:hypothetical protein
MKMTNIAIRFLVVGILTGLMVSVGNAQTSPPSCQKTLASTINVYVFPTEGQTPGTQSKDEAACYQWAVQNTGTDPFELSKQSQQQAQQTQQAQRQAQQVGTGAGVAGAARGAAVGALVGEIASDEPGKGAAWGAAAGAVAGRRRARMARGYAQSQVASQGQQAQQATSNQLANFKKAFSACLEAKKYIVKY